jgi:predicted ATPase/DNA-binding SARP family transcriptional activator
MQTSPASAPPAIPGAAPVMPDLPVQLTAFIGRATELAQLHDLLGSSRLLTLTGAAGSGKTRLALEVARAAAAEGDIAVWWVELAPLADPAHVPQHVAGALRLAEEAGRSPVQALAEAIGARRALLVLDNCEHVVAACAAMSDELLRSCPSLTILATSREALGVAGETAWLVPPLSLPSVVEGGSPESLAGSEAVALFVERARSVMPAFALSAANAGAVISICHRLDGVPLALELAAARVNVLTPQQILARLNDCFSLLSRPGRTTLPRHQTIRAAVDWSYDLLSPPERLLLRRLSVFSGGMTLEAAEQVCAGEAIDGGDVLDLVAALVERSLVVMREQGDSARYHLLEVVRQYAARRLAEDEAEAVEALHRRHGEYYAAVADTFGSQLDVLQAPDAMSRLEAEHDNVRTALERAVEREDGALALRIAGATWPFWLHSAHWSEGLEWFTRILPSDHGAHGNAQIGRALHGAGELAYAVHDHQRAGEWWQAAEQTWTALGRSRELALVNANFGQLLIHRGDFDGALARARSAERFARDAGDPCVLASVLSAGLGFVHAFRGEAAAADAHCAEAQQISLREGYHWGILVASFSRAMTVMMSSAAGAAVEHALACIAAVERLDLPWFVPRVLLVPAWIATEREELPAAARLLGACEALRASAGARWMPVEQPYFDRLLETVRAGLDPVSFERAWTDGRAMTLPQALHAARLAVAADTDPDAAAPSAATRVPAPSTDVPVAALPGQSAEAPTGHAGTAHAAQLCVRALGPLEILRDGELLGTDHWSYAKPRELLLFLLCTPAGATKEEIGRAIWPEGSPAQVRNNLHVTLSHVRKALGAADWIVYAGERYQVNPGRSVAFDFAHFERAASAALADPAASDDRLREVLTMYRGDFLSSEPFGRWHLELRDHALHSYLALLAELAERAFGREDYTEAKRLYRQVVARDDLREDAHRRLMQCLARSGERAHALRHYEGLVQLLEAELDAQPEPETTELYDRLRRAEPA